MGEALDCLNDRLENTRSRGVDRVTRIYWSDQSRQIDHHVLTNTSENSRILDVGCGQADKIIQYAQNGRVCTGIDPLLATSLLPALLRAKEMKVDIGLALAAGEHIPFKDEAFDLVLCLSTLQHVKDQHLTLLEIRRVLGPEGTLVCSVPTYRNASTLFRWKGYPDYVTKGYDRASFIDEIKKAGFQITKLEPFGLFPPKYFGSLQRIDQRVGENVIRGALALSYRMGRICPSGASSLIAIARPIRT